MMRNTLNQNRSGRTGGRGNRGGRGTPLTIEETRAVQEFVGSFATLSQRLQGYVMPILARMNGQTLTRDAVANANSPIGQQTQAPAQPSNQRVRGWDRDGVKDTPYANWLRCAGTQERTSEFGRQNQSLLSAALAASERARSQGISIAEVSAALSTNLELEQIRLLFPNPQGASPVGEERVLSDSDHMDLESQDNMDPQNPQQDNEELPPLVLDEDEPSQTENSQSQRHPPRAQSNCSNQGQNGPVTVATGKKSSLQSSKRKSHPSGNELSQNPKKSGSPADGSDRPSGNSQRSIRFSSPGNPGRGQPAK